jgi:hypothetical protein
MSAGCPDLSVNSFLVHVLTVVLLLVLQLVRAQSEWLVKRKLLVSNGSSAPPSPFGEAYPPRPQGSPRRVSGHESWQTPFGPHLLSGVLPKD